MKKALSHVENFDTLGNLEITATYGKETIHENESVYLSFNGGLSVKGKDYFKFMELFKKVVESYKEGGE